MILRSIRFFLLLTTVLAIAIAAHAQTARTIQSFDQDWRFSKGDAPGAESPAFNDASWRKLDLPHDWSIEGPYDRNNSTGRGGGYLPGGIGWYRKSFTAGNTPNNSRVFIEFDGIMANSDVWINGHHLGKRPNGYAAFQYELTGYLDAGKPNLLAVRADNTIQPASRWYTGAGIYRHVRLVIAAPVHVAHWGSFITASEISAAKANIQIQTTIENQSGSAQTFTLQTDLIAPNGNTAGTVSSTQKLKAGGQAVVLQKTTVSNPALWGIDNPQLYKAVTTKLIDKKKTDEVSNPFGIRDARFEAATGFWLNGKNIKLKGVCLHHDGGAAGAAVPLRVWERRLELLKQAGVNAIRTSHNSFAPEFFDCCDRMGFLVMAETFDTWNARKSNAENGYNLYFTDWWERDTRDMVLQGRNHPSIVIYSVGNEIHDNLNNADGLHKYTMQQDLIHSLDSTRPVTMALFRPALSHVYENGLADKMDVVGQNYRENELVAAHNAKPQRKTIGTENGHGQSAWMAMRDNAFIAGQFLWTGFDYLGEEDWPKVVNGQGLYDRTGTARNIAYQRQSWWSDQPMVYTMRKEQNAGGGDWISDWSPTDIDTYDEARIQVFSNCDEVELFLNGKSLGVKPRPDDNASPRTWNTAFEKGTLKTVGRNNGKVVAGQELITAGKPAKLVLTADKSSIQNTWDDVVYIHATVTDENGNPVLTADNKIVFSAAGAGVIAAVDNGDLSSTEAFNANERWAYKGTCIAIIKANAATGAIRITARADGLQEATAMITVK